MLQPHPIDEYSEKANFWGVFPSYIAHPTFGAIYHLNKKAKNLENSSKFMWFLAHCYDRRSALYNQPEEDRWEAAGDTIFMDEAFFTVLLESPQASKIIKLPLNVELSTIIAEFENTMDTPLGLSLRRLEKKLIERTTFITDTEYSVDYYDQVNGKNILRKGTADQLDKMFAATEKINNVIQTAMDALKASETSGVTKGGQRESLSDGDNNF